MTTLIVFPALNLNPLNTNSFVEYVNEHIHIGRLTNVRIIPAESSTAASTPNSWVWVNVKVSCFVNGNPSLLDTSQPIVLSSTTNVSTQTNSRAKDNNVVRLF